MSERPGWLGVALGTACGLLAGVLVGLAVGAGGGETRTVTAAPKGPPPNANVIERTGVPAVVGERLDVAKDRVQAAGFVVKVEGGGVLGVIRDQNWEVSSVEPPAGALTQTGSTVRLRIERR